MYNNFIIKPMHTCLVFMHCPIFQGLTKFGPGQSILKIGCLWATIPFTKFISYIANIYLYKFSLICMWATTFSTCLPMEQPVFSFYHTWQTVKLN